MLSDESDPFRRFVLKRLKIYIKKIFDEEALSVSEKDTFRFSEKLMINL